MSKPDLVVPSRDSRSIEIPLDVKYYYFMNSEPHVKLPSTKARHSLFLFSNNNQRLALFLLILSAFLARLFGIGHGLPYFLLPDEPSPHLVNTVKVLQASSLVDLATVNIGIYPRFFWYFVSPFFKAASLIGLPPGFPPGFPDTSEWFQIMGFLKQNATNILGLGRFINAVIGTATIPVVYSLGKKVYGTLTGIIAAFFLSFALLHVQYSHFFYPDILVTFFTSLAILFMLEIAKSGRASFYIASAIFAGLAIATKPHALWLLVPFLIAAIYGFRVQKKISGTAARFSGLFSKLFLGLALMAGLGLLGNPLPLVDFQRFLVESRQEMAVFSRGVLGRTAPFGFYIFPRNYISTGDILSLESLTESVGVILVFLSLAGILYALFRRQPQDLILVSFCILFYLFFERQPYKAVRQLLPIVPIMLLLAARVLADLGLKIKLRELYILGIALLVTVPSIYRVIQYDTQLSQKDTRIMAKEWIEENIPKGKKLALYAAYWSNPQVEGLHAGGYERVFIPFYIYNLEGNLDESRAEPVEYYQKEGVDYIITNSYMIAQQTSKSSRVYFPNLSQSYIEFYRSLDENYPLVKTFKPKPWGNPGPEIRIYKLKDD
ncbi:MAG: hypothetical protein DDT23_00977 [candidate division WS2 bacterium]|nr:hypothetical protein [Candidatus Lithacetigena glycinireducens]